MFVSKEWDKVEQTVKADPYIREGVAKVASHTVWNACEPESKVQRLSASMDLHLAVK